MNKIVRDSQILNDAFICEHVNLATARDIDDLQKNRLWKYFLTLKIVFKVMTRLLSGRYDCVYITIFPYGPAFIKDSIIVLLCKLFGSRIVLHLHTYGFKEGSGRNKILKPLYRFVFRNSEVICLSKLLVEDIEDIYNGRVYILPNGIPQVNFGNTYNNSQEPVNLLFLSNLIKGKGILVLIEALEIVKNKGLKFKLRVVGAERDLAYKSLEMFIKEKGLENNVTLLGPKFNDEKYEELRQAGIFVLPSNYDTFGLVLLEAMQFGIPCISTNIGGIPDVLGDGRGVIIPKITPEELAKGIEHLLLNPEVRRDMSNAGFNFFMNNFKAEVFETRLRKILTGEPEMVDERLVNNVI